MSCTALHAHRSQSTSTTAYAVFKAALGVTVPVHGAAELAEHSFYEYQRLVQKEAEPELVIQLPNRLEDSDDPSMRPPVVESEDAGMQTHIELSVLVAFAIEQPKCGLQFHGLYACTDNQVALQIHTLTDDASQCCGIFLHACT